MTFYSTKICATRGLEREVVAWSNWSGQLKIDLTTKRIWSFIKWKCMWGKEIQTREIGDSSLTSKKWWPLQKSHLLVIDIIGPSSKHTRIFKIISSLIRTCLASINSTKNEPDNFNERKYHIYNPYHIWTLKSKLTNQR